MAVTNITAVATDTIHDTANNKVCPKGADCPRVHLDTKKSQKDAKAYKEAQELVQRLKKKAKTGSS